MKRQLFLAVGVLVCAAVLLAPAAQFAENPTTPPAPQSKSTPGLEAAQAISTITGVAISPLLGVSAVGAWKYFRTPPARRAGLPWFGQPWFWVPGLVLVALVFLKDALGTAMPAPLKKPLDVVEAFENKLSALLVAGLFVPLIAAIFKAGATDTSLLQGTGLAMFDPTVLLNVLTIPVAIVAFLVVWLVSHVINVLILISPFGVVDAALKSARLFLLSTLTAVSFADPYVGAVLSLIIIGVCYFLAGWAFRLMVFGTVCGWDLITLRCKRFRPDAQANRAFLARQVEKVPVRTYGQLTRDDQGQLALRYRPWLVLPARKVVLPAGRYAVGRGLVYPEILQLDDELQRAILALPPRYLSHEEELTRLYALEEPRDVGVIKGFKAVWLWLKELFGVRPRPAVMANA
jgi:hypothetical protein